MKDATTRTGCSELDALCALVRAFVINEDYASCTEPICRAMERHPHAPQPHNLMGIVLEKTGDHANAIKHFRAAWALDPTYLPASHNLHTYGTFFSGGRCAFDETDVPREPESTTEILYNDRGIGRLVYKTTIAYDEYGVGRVVRR